MEYQEAFYAIRKAPWNTKKRLWNIKKRLWNTQEAAIEHRILFMVYQEDRVFLWNPKMLSCNNKKFIWNAKKVHSPEYHEAFMEYQETFFMKYSRFFMECQETLSQGSYCGHQEALIGIPRNS